MDHAKESLKSVLESDKYEKVKNVRVFKAHKEFDEKGDLEREFDVKRLHKIADRCNERAKTTGDLSPIGPGHTIKGASETDQPPVWGYAHNFRVAKFGPNQVDSLLCDFYVKKTVKDGAESICWSEGLDRYPRRSVELWVKDGFFDWIALLKRTPKLDLGLLTFKKSATKIVDGKLYYEADMDEFTEHEETGDGRDRMVEEEVRDDPTDPADATIPNDLERDPEQEKMHGYCKSYMKTAYPHLDGMHAKYAKEAEAAAAADAMHNTPPEKKTGEFSDDAGSSGSQTSDDTTDRVPPKKEPMKMSKSDAESVRYAKIERELLQMKKERAQEKANYSKKDALLRVKALNDEGYIIDDEYELAQYMKLGSVEDRDDRDVRIRNTHKKNEDESVPYGKFVSNGNPYTPMSKPEEPGEFKSQRDEDECFDYMRKNNCSFDDAVANYRKK